MKYTIIDSPIGDLLVARDSEGVSALMLPEGRRPARPAPNWDRDDTAFDDVRTQLGEYFAGDRTTFELPLHMIGNAFQRLVWQALLDIPCGETRSYGEVAAAIGAPGG